MEIVRQDDSSAVAGVSRQLAVDLERGKPTTQLGRVLLLNVRSPAIRR